MRIASNRINAVIRYFHDELHPLYPKEEIENFIFLCFEQYVQFTRTDLVLRINETINESDLLKFSFAVKGLKNNVPIQYILGNAYFYGLKFKVDNRVLIPRQETEELVQVILNDVALCEKQAPFIHPSLMLDIGTGSGCIAVALKFNLPQLSMYALDVSEQALEVAKYNAEQHKTAIHFIHGNILTAEVYDKVPDGLALIVSNPPYVKLLEKVLMHKNVLDHEPHLALFVADDDALLFYKAIINLAWVKLKQNGKLFFEINEALGAEVQQLLVGKGFSGVKVLKDINGKNRMVRATLLNKLL